MLEMLRSTASVTIPMSCPACGRDRDPKPLSARPSWLHHMSLGLSPTRDISSVPHHIELPAWLKDLDRAIQASWTTRTVNYSTVACLLLSWEDTDMRYAGKEIKRLKSVLENGYSAEVEHWQIPSRDADLRTLDKVRSFLDQYGHQDNLVLVYYAGHGRPGNSLGGPPVWYARNSEEDTEELDTVSIQQLLTRARDDSPDVLLLHDCCHPLSATLSNSKESRAVVECIFAGGFESRVPISGPDSFTRALTEELSIAESADEPISIVELHRRLICRLVNWQPRPLFDENDEVRKDSDGKTIITTQSRVTPSHVFLSKRDRTIRLVPLSKKGKKPAKSGKGSSAATDVASWPKALLAVRLEDDARNLGDLAAWFMAAPSSVVEFSGIHPSYSSVVMISVSIPVWDMISDSPAVSFVAFTSGARVPELGSARLQHVSLDEGALEPAQAEEPVQEASGDQATASAPRRETEGEGTEQPSELLQPANEDQKTAVGILNAVDAMIPRIMKAWKAERSKSSIPAREWLFERIRQNMSGPERPSSVDKISDAAILAHRDLLYRYLDARDLIENDSGLLNISGRLQMMMGPVYNWRDFDQNDAYSVSISNSSVSQGGIWSHKSRQSMTGTAPSTQGEHAHVLASERLLNHVRKGRKLPSTTSGDQWPLTPRTRMYEYPDSVHRSGDPITGPSENADSYGQDEPYSYMEEHDESNPYHMVDTSMHAENPYSIESGYGYHQAYGYGDSAYQQLDPYGFEDESGPALQDEQAQYLGQANIEEPPQYRIERSERFQPGGVFKVMWSEPRASRSDPLVEGIEDIRSYGEFQVGFRRFIVVANDQGHCTCVPILSYGGRGLTKRGTKPDKHGIAYTRGTKPTLLEGEPTLGFPPIRIEMTAEGEKLIRASRVNYSKLVTVEHNVKVFFIGDVYPADWPLVPEAVNRCWEQKSHVKRRPHRR